MEQNAITKTLKQEIERTRTRDDAWAGFVEISFQEELDAGIGESIAASRWLQRLTGARA